MTEQPRVTVVIPTWNRAALVLEAIESVRRQTYRDFEIVVCDDGSSDDTAARVAALGASVRYLRQPHSGHPGSPRNRGIAAARGEFVAFLDDDDLWQADKLARQVALADRDGLDLVYSNRCLLTSEGMPGELAVTPPPASAEQLLDTVLAGHFPCVCTMLARRSLLRRVDGFDETLATGEDLDLWLRIAPIARAGRVPDPLVIVRRRAGSLSDRAGADTYRNAIRLLRRSLTSGSLLVPQRRLCRATLARLEAGLAIELARGGDHASARKAALGALAHAPTSRVAWAALAATLG